LCDTTIRRRSTTRTAGPESPRARATSAAASRGATRGGPVEAQLLAQAAEFVDHRGEAAVCEAHQREPLLDSAKAHEIGERRARFGTGQPPIVYEVDE